MNPYLTYVESIQAGVQSAKGLAVSGCRDVVESESKVLLFSPHPDDECIIGLLPLRLMKELGKQIINVPVTFGSDENRRQGRANELADACAYLGWGIHREHADFRALDVADVVNVLTKIQPEIIVMPHSMDWNSRHIATHFLIAEALEKMPEAFSCIVVESEYWGAMDDPNLMVEADAEMLAELIAATSLHVEEVVRNPYHLLLPAWMQDNVRRGGELVGGQGGAAPDFSFATLYRLRNWSGGEFVKCIDGGLNIPLGAANLKEIF
ncbi:PIG-L family deacetylase [Pontiellaceae bacterium B12227]|nr:PIG-L family deacetylase [Pontiellaceae bacterium B12227]